MPSTTRRRFLATVGTTSAVLAGCLSPRSPSGDLGNVTGSWPMVGRASGHTRRADDGPDGADPVWAATPDRARAVGTPSVAAGRLYVPVDAVSERARHRYRLHALEAATGDERWQVPLRSEPNPSPAVFGDRIVVTARRSTERGRVLAVGKRYGDEAWLHDVDARLTAPPTVDDATVYVPDWSGGVHALSAQDGSVRWSRRIETAAHGRTFAGPAAVHDGTLYLGSLSGATGVVALDAETGEERWTRSTDSVTAGPVVDDDIVVVRTHRLVAGFHPDGTRRWTVSVPDDWRPLALDDRYVYVPGRDALHAMTRDGEPAWRYRPSDGPVGTPTVAGDRVFVRGEDRLVALSRTAGDVLWTASPDGTGRAVVTREAVFLSGTGGRVAALGDD